MKKMALLLLFLGLALTAYVQQPEKSTKGNYAPEDQISRYAPRDQAFTNDDRKLLYRIDGVITENTKTVDRIYAQQNVLVTIIVALFVGALVLWKELITVQKRVDGIYEI